MARQITIEYTTSADGFGPDATDEDRASFCALVEARLSARYPSAIATAECGAEYLESRVVSNDSEIQLDADELRSWIGVDIWEEWCAGARAEVA